MLSVKKRAPLLGMQCPVSAEVALIIHRESQSPLLWMFWIIECDVFEPKVSRFMQLIENTVSTFPRNKPQSRGMNHVVRTLSRCQQWSDSVYYYRLKRGIALRFKKNVPKANNLCKQTENSTAKVGKGKGRERVLSYRTNENTWRGYLHHHLFQKSPNTRMQLPYQLLFKFIIKEFLACS